MKNKITKILSLVLLISLSGCIQSDIDRYTDMWVLTLVIGVIGFIYLLLKEKN